MGMIKESVQWYMNYANTRGIPDEVVPVLSKYNN